MMAKLETGLKKLWRTLSGENLHQDNALLPSIVKGRSLSLPHRIHLHEIFEELINSNNNETETAREIAIWQENESVTYTELNQRANILARVLSKTLRDHGIELEGLQTNAIVGVFMPSSPNRIAIQLACFKLGLAYLPLDLEFTNQKIEYIVNDVQPLCILIAESNYKARDSLLDSIGNHTLIFFEDLYKTALQRHTKSKNLEPEESLYVSNDPLAVILYTTDSTGFLRGVQINHSNIYNRLLWQWDKIVYQDHDIVCCKSSFLSVNAIWELFACLLRGIPIVLSTPNEVEDILQFSKQISEKYITWAELVPIQLRRWLATLKEKPDLVQKLLSLQTVIVSGDVLSPCQAHLFFSLFPTGKRLISVYGTSESCGFVLSQIYSSADVVELNTESGYLSVGRPIYNTDVYVEDQHLQPVEANCDGEICFSGFAVSNGYWDRNPKPARRSLRGTRRTFTDNLIQPRRGYSQLHCTGDLGFLKSGSVFLKGPIENSVAIDNEKFETGNVDDLIWVHPGIEVCSTIGIISSDGKASVVCFYSVKPFTEVDSSELKAICSRKFPLTVRPEFIQISRVPLDPITYNVDKRKLRQFYLEYTALPSSKSPRQECPTSDNNKIRVILAERLHYTPNEVVDNDNFFSKGGDPVSVAKSVKQLQSVGFDTGVQAFISANCIGQILPMVKHGIIVERTSLEEPNSSYRISPLTESDVDVTYFLTEKLLNCDPLVKAFQVSYEDLANFIEDNRMLATQSGMSLIARNVTDESIVGVAIAYRWEEAPLPSGSAELDMMGEYMRTCATGTDHTAESTETVREGSWLHLFICISDWKAIDGRLALEVSRKLETMVLATAHDQEFCAVETISVNEIDKIIREELGYTTLTESSVHDFLQEYDLPHSEADTDFIGQLMIHQLCNLPIHID